MHLGTAKPNTCNIFPDIQLSKDASSSNEVIRSVDDLDIDQFEDSVSQKILQ